MNVLALDLGTTTGFCMGVPPAEPARLRSGQFEIRPSDKIADNIEDLAQRSLNLEAFLIDVCQFKDAVPDLIAYEAPWSAAADPGEARGAMTIAIPIVLACTVVRFCKERGIRFVRVADQTWRKTYLGKPRADKGEDIKRLAISKGESLGYLKPRTPLNQNNRSDAIGLWFHAQIAYGKWTPPEEMILGQKVAMVKS